jgi:hypothetical protein
MENRSLSSFLFGATWSSPTTRDQHPTASQVEFPEHMACPAAETSGGNESTGRRGAGKHERKSADSNTNESNSMK